MCWECHNVNFPILMVVLWLYRMSLFVGNHTKELQGDKTTNGQLTVKWFKKKMNKTSVKLIKNENYCKKLMDDNEWIKCGISI